MVGNTPRSRLLMSADRTGATFAAIIVRIREIEKAAKQFGAKLRDLVGGQVLPDFIDE